MFVVRCPIEGFCPVKTPDSAFRDIQEVLKEVAGWSIEATRGAFMYRRMLKKIARWRGDRAAPAAKRKLSCSIRPPL
jgi:hypothetical protein